MIDESSTPFYVFYGLVCAALGVAYIRLRSSEGTVITTKEFQAFQSNFNVGYVALILAELVASASFYHTFISMGLPVERIARLYMATVLASTLTAVLMEVVDWGSRKDKCVLSALLYAGSMFSILWGPGTGTSGHAPTGTGYEFLLIGRLVYGVASALQASAFESYVIAQHTSHGFPEDWLSALFVSLTHAMALAAALSGLVGQFASSLGPRGCVMTCCAFFAVVTAYLTVCWEKDMNTPKWGLTAFRSNLSTAVSACATNRQLLYLLIISACYETSIIVFGFHWAPWLTSLAPASSTSSASSSTQLPLELTYSTLIAASMLGNYLHQVLAVPPEQALQWLLVVSAACYSLAGMFNTFTLSLPVAVAIHLLMGVYWPVIGHYRGRVILPELRAATLLLPKLAVLALTALLLGIAQEQVLFALAALTGLAAYVQVVYLDKALLADEDEDEGPDEEEL